MYKRQAFLRRFLQSVIFPLVDRPYLESSFFTVLSFITSIDSTIDSRLRGGNSGSSDLVEELRLGKVEPGEGNEGSMSDSSYITPDNCKDGKDPTELLLLCSGAPWLGELDINLRIPDGAVGTAREIKLVDKEFLAVRKSGLQVRNVMDMRAPVHRLSLGIWWVYLDWKLSPFMTRIEPGVSLIPIAFPGLAFSRISMKR